MILSLAIAAGLADKCARPVARETLLSVFYNESHFDTLAIGDNTDRRSIHPRTRNEAVAIAQELIARGHNIDMGIGQVNSRTAPRLGLTVYSAFDACANMAAASSLMASNYKRVAKGGTPQQSLAAMLSMYNTGNSWRGFGNGYVGRVYRVAATIVPMLGRTARVDVDPRMIEPAQGEIPSPIAAMKSPASSGEPRAIPVAIAALPTQAPMSAAWAAFGNPANVMVFGSGNAGSMEFNHKEKSR